ncbi:response regulator [Bacteroides sp. OttesenSCG-928-D19]|nr:response regulator [Bacteroides sp. OttesenSCG-928-N06]MDL2304228.1 response regulator [Bacteroides sp. OttesenSCG-928-D19]
MKARLRLIPILLSTLMLATLAARAQEQFASRYNFSYVTMDNGLLHNFIDCIHKDTHGFLWVATRGGGLSRYDGYEFTHYNINTHPAKLKSNFINNCCEDDFGRLWITSGEGIDILDLSTGRIITPYPPHSAIATIFQQPSSQATKDSRGNIWLYSSHTVYKVTFDAKGNIHKHYALLPASPEFPEISIEDVDEDGDIWLAAGNRINKIHTGQDELYATPISPQLEFEEALRLRDICVKENEIWIATEIGLIRYNRNEDIVKRYLYDETSRGLTQNFITSLAVSAEKQLIISTLRGLNIYNPVTDDFEQIMLDPRNQNNYLNSNFIDCMLTDGDIIWVGTETGGLNKITPKSLYTRNYVHSEQNPKSLSPNPVNAIYEDENQTLWVGTVEGGLNKKHKNSEDFTLFTTQNSGLSHNSVSAIIKDNRHQLWVGTWGHGITIFNPDKPGLPVNQLLNSWTNAGFPMNFVGSLCYDPINDLMWIGTGWGIYYYDYATDYMYSPFTDENMANQIQSSLGAVIDTYGQLWMGCSNGIFVFDLHSLKDRKFKHTHLKYKLDDPTSRLGEKISSIYLDSDSVLWMGSNGNGLFKHLPKEDGSIGRFINYNTTQGLISNTVRGILEDDRKQLWISTNNGLSCFDPATQTFVNYRHNDGLVGNQFYWNAALKSKSGLLYFGAIEGLSIIDPNRRNTRTISPTVALTKLSVMNEVVQPGAAHIDTDISMAKAIRLHESDKSFSLEFAALNFESPATATYSYRLKGFDNQWIDVPPTRRFANYTNLPAGKYTFQVKYSVDGKTTDNPVTEVSIIVSPFFYKTGWFISLMMILIICLVIYIYIRRISTLQKQKEHLHRTVEERTRELKEQNEKITQQKNQLIQMSKKVQELTMDKISFFTSITHEFRTPITLIIGPIERALKLSYNPQVIEQLNFVERNSKYLLSLVNQLMDFRKVESGKMEFVQSKGDFRKFISSIVTPFEALAGDRRITLEQHIRLEAPEFMFDQDAMQKVITNLMSNAMKFTPDGGKVSLYVASLQNHPNGTEKLYLCIRDTGVGIPEEDLPKIFNRFYQSRSNVKYPVYGQSGTGIGLYLCKRIVQQLGGTINAFNNKVAGSSFRILLPLQRQENEAAHELTINSPVVIHQESTKLPPHFVAGHLTILIVEDNADMRSFIRSILIEHYNILEAADGQEALAVLGRNNVDFIISDLMMPVMDGIELSRKVKENFAISHIPFLMLTAKTSQEARIESYKTGVDSYLLKPFSEELLLTRIGNILDNRKRYQRQFANNMDVAELQMEEESSDKKFLDKALDVIHENYKNSYYESSDFIDAMGVSKSLLNKKLQTLTGQSIGQFIRNYRLNIARELIEKNRVTRNMNISEIAYEVGFNDPKYFTRCFTKRFNVPPSSLMEAEEGE